MYYEKVGLALWFALVTIEPDYPNLHRYSDQVDEHRIVGPTGGEVGITSVKSGDGSTVHYRYGTESGVKVSM